MYSKVEGQETTTTGGHAPGLLVLQGGAPLLLRELRGRHRRALRRRVFNHDQRGARAWRNVQTRAAPSTYDGRHRVIRPFFFLFLLP